ncbi:hypothetical protein HDU97_004068 [Phlyctochytrium planicorne]|nr:hypothetical protein HDU97_004068 [Phlyctochytrium planicorne]
MTIPQDPETLAKYVEGLEKQLEQLREIVLGDAKPDANGSAVHASSDGEASKDSDKRIKELEEQNQKLKYRIKILLRNVDAKREQIEKLEGK